MPFYTYRDSKGNDVEVMHNLSVYDAINEGRFDDIPEDVKEKVLENGKVKMRIITPVRLSGFDKLGRSKNKEKL